MCRYRSPYDNVDLDQVRADDGVAMDLSGVYTGDTGKGKCDSPGEDLRLCPEVAGWSKQS